MIVLRLDQKDCMYKHLSILPNGCSSWEELGIIFRRQTTATENKQKLLAMPQGSKRPKQRTELGRALCNYSNQTSKSYDPVFDKAIRERQLQWWLDTAAVNKQQLLAMPRGAARLSPKNKLYGVMGNYLHKKSRCYDPVFDKAIRERQPQWFDKVGYNKIALMSMPQKTSRPNKRTTKLGAALSSYTCKAHICYDPEFDAAIRKKYPHWWLDTAKANKQQLLLMSCGTKRPSVKTKLGSALGTYVKNSSSSYDPIFDKAIREKQPQWFAKTSDENKRQLLALPLGWKRPNKKITKLGAALVNYTCKHHASYDPIFDKTIREKQPQWWLDSAGANKQYLLAIPNNMPKPNCKTSLGRVLRDYTCKNRNYDPIFDNAIRKKQPQWFVIPELEIDHRY